MLEIWNSPFIAAIVSLSRITYIKKYLSTRIISDRNLFLFIDLHQNTIRHLISRNYTIHLSKQNSPLFHINLIDRVGVQKCYKNIGTSSLSSSLLSLTKHWVKFTVKTCWNISEMQFIDQSISGSSISAVIFVQWNRWLSAMIKKWLISKSIRTYADSIE